jgi:hypothetical protein
VGLGPLLSRLPDGSHEANRAGQGACLSARSSSSRSPGPRGAIQNLILDEATSSVDPDRASSSARSAASSRGASIVVATGSRPSSAPTRSSFSPTARCRPAHAELLGGALARLYALQLKDKAASSGSASPATPAARLNEPAGAGARPVRLSRSCASSGPGAA